MVFEAEMFSKVLPAQNSYVWALRTHVRNFFRHTHATVYAGDLLAPVVPP